MAGTHGANHNSTDALRVAFLGLNAWAVVILIPSLHAEGIERAPLLVLPLLALIVVGVSIYRMWRAIPWVALVLFPCTIAGTIALEPRLRRGDAFSVYMLVAGVLSFAAYAAVAAIAAGRRTQLRQTTEHALAQRAKHVVDRHRTTLRRGLLIFGAAVAVALIAVAPYVGVRRSLDDAWKDASAEGATLTALVAGILATLVIATFVGPALRAPRRRSSREKINRARRVVPLLLLVAVGVTAYVLYVRQA
ncbi:MAG: hypothetical protein IPK60_17165 [Sandaracinaceae bacterium]|nr:hypothetical protein [Sandaracinaceae bacterium]